MLGSDVFGRDGVAVLTAAQSLALDRDAEARHGIAGRVLMENAGRSAAEVIERLYPRGRVVAVVGSGNNGGDALVTVRTLGAWGREVAYVAVGSREPDATLLHGHGVAPLPVDALGAALRDAAVVVDGILGTGASGAPRGRAAEAIRAVNASGAPVVALDVPSGVDGTTGRVAGEAIQAEATVTFGWPKLGLFFFPGRSYCGRLIAVEIGFPPLEPGFRPAAELATPGWAAARLPTRAPDAYKATAGRVLVAAGSDGMAGAAIIAAHASLRAGAGYVRIASPAGNRTVLQSALPEAVYVDAADGERLDEAAAASDAVLAGPGMGTDAASEALLRRVLERTGGRPAVIDADALTLLARDPEWLAAACASRAAVLTPHPGEMSRLTGQPVAALLEDPAGAARELADRLGCVVLLKGAPSIIASPGEPVLINTVGSSDVAKAGMGDQLAGTIAALLAAGAPARVAAGLGLFYAGRAADLVGRGRTLGPRDVSDALARAFSDPGATSSPLGLPFVTFDQPPRW